MRHPEPLQERHLYFDKSPGEFTLLSSHRDQFQITVSGRFMIGSP